MQHDLECGLPVMPSCDRIGFHPQALILETAFSTEAKAREFDCADISVGISPFYLCWRKSVDMSFGIIGTALLALMLPFLALLIYLDSPGPIFYFQERLGLYGKPFRICKFRSMCVDAEHAGHAVWASVRDPRVTRVGRFMRAIHLDELPQVINILCGEMSLIGPRPEREEFAVKLARITPSYCSRVAVKPGVTGWAQVKYPYGNTVDDALNKLQYDLYYIQHQSFMLDSRIIFKTIGEVVFHRGT